jgi:rSAM/selenodomain-associated transferase 2
MPALDVVIPTLDAAATLSRTLSVVRQANPSTITVCDGGSRDGTTSVAAANGATVLGAAAGRGGQLAAGGEAGSAPWLLFLHADTVPGEGWVEAVGRFTSEPPNATKAGYFRLRLDSSDARARRVERLARWRCDAFGLPYGDQGLLIARAFYRRLGGFRPLPLMEDVDLVRRVGRRNLVALDACAITSAARYERDGWLARPTRNLSCLALYFAGVSPQRIARLYHR